MRATLHNRLVDRRAELLAPFGAMRRSMVGAGRACVAALLVVTGAVALDGCMGPRPPVASMADYQRLGSRTFAGHTHDEVGAAVVVALRVIGYEVVAATPRIRTAPRTIAVGAVARGYVAQSVVESLSWDVELQDSPQGPVVHAMLHYLMNGEEQQAFLGPVEAQYAQFYREVASNLPTAQGATLPPSTSGAVTIH